MIQDKIRQLLAAAKNADFSGMNEAERAAKQDKMKEERLALIHEFARLASGDRESGRGGGRKRCRRRAAFRWRATPWVRGASREALARILDFDPKQRGVYYNRCSFILTDLDEECKSPFTSILQSITPHGPMRYTYRNERGYHLSEAINILSVKIACSDVGFPVHVYGTVIARDSMDEKCIYLFRRDRDHCQLINSEDGSLILTGPKRGLVLLDDNYVEIDLKIKDHLGQDRELSKGTVTIRGIAGRSFEKCVVEIKSLATRLSTVDVICAVVIQAVEATIAVEVLQGDFYGEITAYTTSIKDRLVLYDSEVARAMTGDDCGLWSYQAYATHYEDEIAIGANRMRVKVAWSVMNP
ncbi:hypothetical protein HU200_034248 [Digitaria exilis]|uniref:DUF6598 domain-containing protein n=1 Tax=Digitaria exilis TaxID=1010633 RepID=A0A835EM51_9POAL|nr:hypothetical protein HU200_034248 [Digitaria exilis]